MLHLTVLTVGRIKNQAIKNLQSDYLERLSRYVPCEIIEIPDSSFKEPQRKMGEEEKGILGKLRGSDYVVVLDERGDDHSSSSLSSELRKIYDRGTKRIVFVVGGPFGLSESIKKKAHRLLSLSKLTLPHELARVVLLEQLYRAHTILRGEKYHH